MKQNASHTPSNAEPVFPPKLYLFMPSEYLLDCLEKDEIKVCLPKDCNDPFECMPRIEEGKPRPDTGGVGFICFSREWASSTMWAHYADKHQGVCLEFTFPLSGQEVSMDAENGDNEHLRTNAVILDLQDQKPEYDRQYTLLPCDAHSRYAPILRKVEYHPRRAYPAREVVKHKTDAKAIYANMCFTKGQEWAYEKEWRLFVSLDNCLSYHDGCYFVKGLTRYISKVMLGWKCELPQAYVQCQLDSMPDTKATCVKMEPAGNLFAVTEKEKATGTDSPVWRLSLEFKNAQWQALKNVIIAEAGLETVKSGGYESALFNLLKNQYNLPE